MEKLFNWFQYNNFKANAPKCHIFLSPYKPFTIKRKETAIESSSNEKLLGVTIDNKFSFDNQITNLYRRKSQKLNALSKVASYMNFDQKIILLKTFITSQFIYCSLVWMCHSKGLNNRINNLHEPALSIVYQYKKSDFETLFKMTNLLKFTGETYIIFPLKFIKSKIKFLHNLRELIFTFKKMGPTN